MNLRGRSRLARLVLALGVVALLATSCSSDDDDAGESGSDSSDTTTESADADAAFDSGRATDDAMAEEEEDGEAFFAEEEPAEEMEEDDMAEEEADAEGLFDSASDDSGDDSGLFGDEEDEPAEERLENNTFQDYGVRPFVDTEVDNRSTFALDVDTGSYVITRRWLDEGILPEPDSVRVEEFVNAFDYDYDTFPAAASPCTSTAAPPPSTTATSSSGSASRPPRSTTGIDPPAALTFVVDTSGSMDRDDRLGLVKEALIELVDELDDEDTVAIVTYGDRSAIILEPTEARNEREIVDAIEDLRPGGSTNLEAGLETAYDLAERAFVEGGIQPADPRQRRCRQRRHHRPRRTQRAASPTGPSTASSW